MIFIVTSFALIDSPLDTNILFYAMDRDEGQCHNLAMEPVYGLYFVRMNGGAFHLKRSA